MFLTGDAVSPAFATALDDAGRLAEPPRSPRPASTPTTWRRSTRAPGGGGPAYLAALRVTAEDGDVTDFFDDEKFETVAGAADARSHDAVVALVTAAAAAASADPADVQRGPGRR